MLYLELGQKSIGKTFVVRPIGSPEVFYKAVVKTMQEGKLRYNSVIISITKEEHDAFVAKDPNFNITDHLEKMARNHPLSVQHNIKFSPCYAINCIDRADGQIKVLEKGESIFGVFKQFAEFSTRNPSGKDGADFKIYVSGKKGKDYYQVGVANNNTTILGKDKDGNVIPNTKENVASVKEKMYDLAERYKKTPDESWQKWVGNIVEDNGDESGQVNNQPSQAAKQVQSAAKSQPQQRQVVVEDSENDSGDEIPF